MKRWKAAIFDMDGTVLNTLPDLGAGIRQAFAAEGSTYAFTDEDTGAFFGSGVHVAITRAMLREKGVPLSDLECIGTDEGEKLVSEYLSAEETSKRRPVLEQVYREYYSAHNADLTSAYGGILPLLVTLREAGIKTAVVSNKPDKDCRALADHYFPGGFDFCLGERPEIPRKPAPEMTLLVLEELAVPASEAVYIGDSEIDLQTAVNAGLSCIMVTWGFRNEEFIRKKIAAAAQNGYTDITVVNTPEMIVEMF